MNREDVLLGQATKSMCEYRREPEELAAAAERVAAGLGIPFTTGTAVQSCDDMQPLLAAYRAGTLPESRALLVEAHLHECGVCLRRYRSGSDAVDWSAPRIMPAKNAVRPWHMAWAIAASLAMAATGLFV